MTIRKRMLEKRLSWTHSICSYLVGQTCLFSFNNHQTAFSFSSRGSSSGSRGSSSTGGDYKVHFFYNDIYEVAMPEAHRFPMEKYRMVRETIQREYAHDPRVVLLPSPEATEQELCTAHCPQYVHRYLTGQMTDKEVRRTGFPWNPQHVRRSTSSVGGTIAATRALLLAATATSETEVADKTTSRSSSSNVSDCYSIAGHLAGGTHHAFRDYGEGFCVFSDIAVAAHVALNEFPAAVQRVAIIDLDVHQGNGNAVLFQRDSRVFTFSLHCSGNFFSAKQQSDADVELPTGCGDSEYLRALKTWLPYLVDVVRPQLVFLQAGVDPFHGDRLGKMALSRTALSKRNRLVFDLLRRKGIKCVVTMGGGYPTDLNPQSAAYRAVVECHADVYRDCIASCAEAACTQ